MTIQQFIEKAIEGGWEPKDGYVHGRNGDFNISEMWVNSHAILLDPLAWKAVGKVEGWDLCPQGIEDCGTIHLGSTLHIWKEMLDALWLGKTIDQYLETL